MYLLAMVTGFMLNTCSKSNILERLEEENYDLRWENSVLTTKLENAERKLKTEDDSTDS